MHFRMLGLLDFLFVSLFVCLLTFLEAICGMRIDVKWLHQACFRKHMDLRWHIMAHHAWLHDAHVFPGCRPLQKRRSTSRTGQTSSPV